MLRNILGYSAIAAALQGSSESAPADKYNITAYEHAACDADAASLCGDAADEDHLLACLRTKRMQLTPGCRSVFEAGLRKRHMPM